MLVPAIHPRAIGYMVVLDGSRTISPSTQLQEHWDDSWPVPTRRCGQPSGRARLLGSQPNSLAACSPN